METIKVHDYEQSKKESIRERMINYWKTMKNILPYILIVIFVQLINIILIVWILQYTEGVTINIAILFIIITYLVIESTHKKKRSTIMKKFRGFLRILTLCLMPLVILFFVITILLVAYKPKQNFPNEWKYSDNSWARFASVDKFRVSQIELEYPVTFKITAGQLDELVTEWIESNKYNYGRFNITIIDPVYPTSAEKIPDSSTERHQSFSELLSEKRTIGVNYHFSNYGSSSLFGMVNDVFIRVVEWSDVWGAVKLEAHSNIRLGLKDYDTNLEILDSLYRFIGSKTEDFNQSPLLWEHQQIVY